MSAHIFLVSILCLQKTVFWSMKSSTFFWKIKIGQKKCEMFFLFLFFFRITAYNLENKLWSIPYWINNLKNVVYRTMVMCDRIDFYHRNLLTSSISFRSILFLFWDCLIENESTFEENNFNDRGDTSLDSLSKTYKYTLSNGYECELAGWTHTRNYAKGFLTNQENTNPRAVIKGLEKNTGYRYKIYQ